MFLFNLKSNIRRNCIYLTSKGSTFGQQDMSLQMFCYVSVCNGSMLVALIGIIHFFENFKLLSPPIWKEIEKLLDHVLKDNTCNLMLTNLEAFKLYDGKEV